MLLVRAARVLRELLSDPYFPRRFSGLAFSEEDFRKAVDVFGDVIASKPETARAKEELRKIEDIQSSTQPAGQKCQEVWQLIQGRNP